MFTNWRTLATPRTHSWTRCPWQNTPSSRLPGVWSGATDGTSERFTAKAKRPSWRTSLAQRLPLRQPLKLPQAVAEEEAQPRRQPLALPLRQPLKLPQAVAVGEAEPLRQPLAQRLPLRQTLKLPQAVAVGEADSLPPEDTEWWTSTPYCGYTQEKLVSNSNTS